MMLFSHLCSAYSFNLVKKNLLGAKKGFWGFVETLEKASGEIQETISAVKAIPGIKYVLLNVCVHSMNRLCMYACDELTY